MITSNEKRKSRIIIPAAVAMTCTLLGVAAGVFAKTGARDIVTAIDEVTFSSPPMPNGTSMASAAGLWSDPATGGGSALVKFTKGSTTKHYHTNDEQVVLVKGTAIHWAESLPETRTKRLQVGSFWYVPAGAVHQDICVTDECILYVLYAKGETKVVEDVK